MTFYGTHTQDLRRKRDGREEQEEKRETELFALNDYIYISEFMQMFFKSFI